MGYLPKKTVLSAILVLLVFAGIFTFSMLDACPVKQKNCKNGREPVAFPHGMHMGAHDCLKCHHIYDSQHNNILDPGKLYSGTHNARCASCHGPDSSIKLTEAFHMQCIGCHMESSSIHRAGGPNLCGECHRDNKAAAESVMILGEKHD
ncbi:MAG: cytochrome c3 family protein [Desulfosalsimonadaceae bacterium]